MQTRNIDTAKVSSLILIGFPANNKIYFTSYFLPVNSSDINLICINEWISVN